MYEFWCNYLKPKKIFLKKKYEKVIGLMKDDWGGQIMKKIVELRANTFKRKQWWK